MRPWARLGIGALSSGLACLPAGETIPKGAVFASVQAEAGSLAPNVITTDDGWAITVERVLGSIAVTTPLRDRARDAGNCSDSDLGAALVDLSAKYTFEVRAIDTVGCSFWVSAGYQINTLGPGVTEADARPFRVPDAVVVDPATGEYPPAPPDFRVTGVAHRGTVTLRFDLALGSPFLGYVLAEGQSVEVQVRANDRVDIDFFFASSQLFRTTLTKDQGPLRFDGVALADTLGDRNGVVTQDELNLVPTDKAASKLDYSYTGKNGEASGSSYVADYFSQQTALAWRGAVR